MNDDSKSVSSVGSTGHFNTLNQDQFKRRDVAIFSLFFPLSKQTKHPNPAWEWTKFVLISLEMFALTFFRVNPTTHEQTMISSGIGFLDLSSLQKHLSPYFTFVSIGLFAYIILLLLFLLISAILHPKLIGTQPWIITLVRALFELTVTVLLIPLINLAIHQFDCHIGSDKVVYFRGTTIQAFGDTPIPNVVGFVLSVAFLIVLFVVLVMYHLFIYQHNPKYGGLFSAPTFTFQLIKAVLLFGTVFAMRTLIAWPFWRFVVTVGVSVFLVLYIFTQLPFYHLIGNYLSIVQWTVFGSLRAFLELGYLISGFITSSNAEVVALVVTIVSGVVGLGCGIGLSLLFFKLLQKQTRRRWLLTDDGMPLTDADDTANNFLPKMKNTRNVEPAVRFLQHKQFKTYDYYQYADLIYTTALKKHKTHAELQFHYANFLAVYRKNHVKAQSVNRTARMSSPPFPLRFVLFCQSKDQSQRGGAGNEMANAQFQGQIGKAEEMHEIAKNAMRDFFSNLTAPNPKLSVIPTLLRMIVENEAKARKIYEDLLTTHPQSTQLLRQYAALLLDIFNDEDMADIILHRADEIEEDSTSTLPTASGGTDPQAAVQVMDPNAHLDEKASRISGASGMSGAAMRRKKKQKKKKRGGDTLVTELGGSGATDLKSLKNKLCLALTLQHFLMCISMAAGLAVFIVLANTYSNDLTTLREVLRLAEHTGRSSMLALALFANDVVYGFTYDTPPDGKVAALMRAHVVQQNLVKSGAYITSIVTRIADLTSYIDPWVSPDVDVYDFTMEDVAITTNTSFPRVDSRPTQPMVTSQSKQRTTLSEALISIAQKESEMGKTVPVPTDEPIPGGSGNYTKVEYVTFTRDMAYLVNNSPQGIMNALKRAIFSYMDETTDEADLILKVYLSVLLGTSMLVASSLVIVYAVMTMKMRTKRRRALMDLLEVPKPKLQSVIRRLITQNNDDSMTGTLGGNGNETEDEEGEYAKVSEDEGGVRESEASDETRRTEGVIGVLNVMSEVHRPVSQSFNTLPYFDSQAQSLALLQPLSDITLDMPSFSNPSDFNHLPPKHHASHSAIMPSLSFPAPNHTTSQVNIGDGKSPAIGMNGPFSFGLQPMRSSPQSPQAPNLFLQSQADLPLSHSLSVVQMPSQKNSMLGGRQTPLSHWSSMSVLGMGQEKMNETAQLRAEAKKRKEEAKKMKELEEEKQRKAEEKVKAEEEVRRRKEEQAALLSSGKATEEQKGFVRNVVEDDKWEEKMEMDEARLRDMHMHLPDPVTKGFILVMVLDLSLGLLMLTALIVVAVVMVLSFRTSAVNLTMSGMRSSVLALSEFLLIRFLFPLANVTPTDPNITFDRSTNPVFKGFEHTSTDRDLLFALFANSSDYFHHLHLRTHYGASEDTIVGDPLYDEVQVTRLSTLENEMTLLRLQDCLMEEEENSMCDVVDRVFHIDFPVFGLSSLIAQMRFYVWMMEQDNYQQYDNLHPNPRFLASAFRFDLRSGLNKLTNEIRDTAKSTVSTSETVMTILTVAACVIFLVGLFVFARMWVNMLIQTNEESEKLMDLLPISSDEREMELLPSMLTGYQPMDQARQKIIEAALTVLESIAKNDKKEELATNLDFLMIATTQAFTEEESEMLKRDYEHTEHHTREHLLIRQRLTHISDEMKKKDTASVRIAIRHLIRLFDKHFTDDDVQYGNIIPAEEKTTMQNEQRNEEWEEAEDVGELGEPGQVEGL